MYRSDKQFMKNPATASSRVYVGSIAETVVAPDLEEKFSVHGQILGLVLQRGFGFIQFESDSQAQSAIRNEHGSLFHGRKLNVRQAVDKTRSNGPQSGPSTNTPSPAAPQSTPTPQPLLAPQPLLGPQPLLQKRISPPVRYEPPPPTEEMDTSMSEDNLPEDKQVESESELSSRFNDANSDSSDRRRHNQRGGSVGGRGGTRDRNRHRDHDFNIRDIPPRDLPPRDLPPRDLPPRDLPPRDLPSRELPPRDISLYYPRDEPARPLPGFVPPPLIERPDRNDCEIIVVSKLLTEYAEYIEHRLKSIGLVVDLLYPNEDVPLGKVLANISSRGCLYAILVMPQNEEYRSLTLSILHGIPQEHRNMPIDDALMLITRNFDAYMRGEKTGSNSTGPATLTLKDRHPEQIQMLFNLLAENRQISSVQYDRLVKYLQDRRELQSQYEMTEGTGDGNGDAEPNSKQAELQSRIMNILNKSADDSPKPVEPPAPPPPGPTPLLNDPTVQKALDSLLSGDMFKTISSGF